MPATPEQRKATLEYRAEILVEAYVSRDDKKTAAAHGIADRTLRAWRQQLGTDAQFAEILRAKKRLAENSWADSVPLTLRRALDFIGRAATEGDTKSPDMLHAVAGAFKLVAEVDQQRFMLERRLGALNVPASVQAGSAGTAAGQVVPAGGAGATTAASTVTH